MAAANMSNTTPVPIAILDDYQSVALTMVDWPPLKDRADIAVFSDHLTDEDSLAERLAPFDVLCVMRERTASRGSPCVIRNSPARSARFRNHDRFPVNYCHCHT
jgi:hypothetical protein